MRNAPGSRALFLNLPVADLEATKAFFGGLGFDFEPRFTDARAAAMILNEGAWVMLLKREFFKTFTPRSLCETSAAVEALIAFEVGSRAEVDALTETAVAQGGQEARPPMEHGSFMYSRSFFDLDGHQWEVLYTDHEGLAGEQGAGSEDRP
ncbi:hypothetical protein G6O69_02395 [Pseudenhygromyxa sp. WMMC2535]|uniref:VOC family protein n=1 Tax=Pseudenhygromyxa sp. WMMC2535 TaxID=2712867 RepID=UPI001553A0A7|nr:VOC family protein [Pseudenhygromyxa sp. WMMC2535]NVB36664.1 hypothetical protein [Pseudenhygromyxa sp. WMMC2535]